MLLMRARDARRRPERGRTTRRTCSRAGLRGRRLAGLRRLLAAIVMLAIGLSSVEVLFGAEPTGTTPGSAAVTGSLASPVLVARGGATSVPGDTGPESGCLCMCLCGCAHAQSAVSPRVSIPFSPVMAVSLECRAVARLAVPPSILREPNLPPPRL